MQVLQKGGKSMSDQQQKSLEQILEDLKSKLKEKNVEVKEFEEYYKKSREMDREFLSLLEWACDIKKDDKKLHALLRRFSVEKVSHLMDDLRRLGYAIQKDLGENFRKSGYRLLEQIRAGQKNEVFYGISRIFISHNRNVPDAIHEAFKPYYDNETFQCLMYTFLSSAIEKTEE